MGNLLSSASDMTFEFNWVQGHFNDTFDVLLNISNSKYKRTACFNLHLKSYYRKGLFFQLTYTKE